MKKILFSCCVLSIVFMYGVGFCTYTGESPESDSPSSGNSLFTKYEDEVLSVDIKDVPLGEVLQKLSDETGILFSFAPAVGEESVMVRFSNFKIADALNKILSSHDRIFIYEENQPDSDESLPSKLKEVRIFTPATKITTKGSPSKPATTVKSASSKSTQTVKNNTTQRKTGKRSSPRTRGKQQTIASLADDLKDSDPNVRLDAVRNLRSIGNADAIGHLTSALEDKDPQVRNDAVSALEALQEDKTDTTDTEVNQQIAEGAAPNIDFSTTGDSTVEIYLTDVQEPLLSGALMVTVADPDQLKFFSPTTSDGWDPNMSSVKALDEPGRYLITVGNLSNNEPDENGNIGLAKFPYQCPSGNCTGQKFSASPVGSGYDGFVGGKSSVVYDSSMTTRTYTIE